MRLMQGLETVSLLPLKGTARAVPQAKHVS